MIRRTLGVLTLLTIAVALLVLGGALYAQQRDGEGMHGRMMGMMPMMESCPMMGAMAGGPEAALRNSEELALTDAQVGQLEALQSRAGQDRTQAMENVREVRQEIARVHAAESFDERAARAAYDRMAEIHTDMGVAMASAADDVRSILTPEQREQLREMGGGMPSMMERMEMMRQCPMMQGMMEGGPMMQGGMEECECSTEILGTPLHQ